MAADTSERLDFIDEAELEALALAADPDAPLPDDAVPLLLGDGTSPILPSWYMPPALSGAGSSRRGRRIVVLTIILAFVAIDAAGLCSTYGKVGFG